MTNPTKLWCVLRTAGPRTLMLAKSLNDAGIEAWAPAEVRLQQLPRSSKHVDRTLAMLPTFVFAVADRIVDLTAISHAPSSQHPAFTLFRHADRYPLIADRGLKALREIERARRSKRALNEKRARIPIGTRVRVTEGPGSGLRGTVEGGDDKFTTVTFLGSSIALTFATFILVKDVPEASPPDQGNAAGAAW